MAEKNLGIGIVGAGQNTQLRHIPGLREQENVEIVSVCNRSKESGEKAAKVFSIPKVYTSWKELVRSDEIDAVLRSAETGRTVKIENC